MSLFKKKAVEESKEDQEQEEYDDEDVKYHRIKNEHEKMKTFLEKNTRDNSSLKRRIKENEKILEDVLVENSSYSHFTQQNSSSFTGINTQSNNVIGIGLNNKSNIYTNLNRNSSQGAVFINKIHPIHPIHLHKQNSFLHAMKTDKTLFENEKKDSNLESQVNKIKNNQGPNSNITDQSLKEPKELKTNTGNTNIFSIFNVNKAKNSGNYIDSMFNRNNRSKVKLENNKRRSNSLEKPDSKSAKILANKGRYERGNSNKKNKDKETNNKNLLKSNNKKKSETKKKHTEKNVYKRY